MFIFCANNIPLTPLGIKVYGHIISQQFAPKKLALILEQQKTTILGSNEQSEWEASFFINRVCKSIQYQFFAFRWEGEFYQAN